MEGYVLKLATERKSIRAYSSEEISLSKVLYAIRAALQAPSGANQQPWSFIVIQDPKIKEEIRKACESGERRFYRMVRGGLREWLESKGLNWEKPFLIEAPYLIAVFAQLGKPFSIQSTWLAIGYLLLALEEVGLASLTYTPPNPSEISRILGVPRDMVLQTIIPVGKAKGEKKKEPRKDLEETTYLNRWGSPLVSVVKET